MPLEVRPATTADLGAVVEIYNEGIRERVATFETLERTLADVTGWLSQPYPFLVAKSERVTGWVAGSAYSERDCYAGMLNFSIYVAGHARGQGIGLALMTAFIAACEGCGFSKLTSRIFPENKVSLALMATCGFRVVGTHVKHAQLDAVWRDVVVVEKPSYDIHYGKQPLSRSG